MSTIELIIRTAGKYIRFWKCSTCGACNSDIVHARCQFCGQS